MRSTAGAVARGCSRTTESIEKSGVEISSYRIPSAHQSLKYASRSTVRHGQTALWSQPSLARGAGETCGLDDFGGEHRVEYLARALDVEDVLKVHLRLGHVLSVLRL